MPEWQTVCTTSDVQEDAIHKVEVENRGVILMRCPAGVRAYLDACPHQGTPLHDGDLYDGVLTCSLHLWEFDAATGEGINPCGEQLTVVDVRESGEAVEVDVATLAAVDVRH